MVKESLNECNYKGMTMIRKILLSAFIVSIVQAKPTLIFYCGITMVKPIQEIAKIIEKRYNCTIKISQGGSKDLYESLKYSKQGDLYLPGSDSYRKKNMKDGLLLNGQYIGFNKASIFVQKGNPKKIKDLNSMIDENVKTIICNPDSGSIGKATKKIIIEYKNLDFYEEVFDVAYEIGTDSRDLNQALIDKKVDMTINWRATGFFPENSPFISVIDIDERYAPKKKLVISLLSFSKYPNIAKKFMEYASSNNGQKIMRKYGFLN